MATPLKSRYHCALSARRAHEPPQSPRHRQQHDAAVAHPGFRARFRHRPHLRRRHRHRRFLRRLQAAQPAAAAVRRRCVLAGLRAHPRGVPQPPRRRRNPRPGRPCRHPARHRRAGGRRHRHLRRPAGDLRLGARIRGGRREVRADGRTAAHHLSLHPVHGAGGAGRRHPQHLEPLRRAGLHAGAAQPVASSAWRLFAAPWFDPPVLALAWAVFLGGVLQLALQLPFLARIGMLPRCGPVAAGPGVYGASSS